MGICIRQGDLFYSAGLHRNHVLAKANTGKIGRGLEKMEVNGPEGRNKHGIMIIIHHYPHLIDRRMYPSFYANLIQTARSLKIFKPTYGEWAWLHADKYIHLHIDISIVHKHFMLKRNCWSSARNLNIGTAYNQIPEGRPGMCDGSLLSGISGCRLILLFSLLFLFFCRLLLLFLSCPLFVCVCVILQYFSSRNRLFFLWLLLSS